MSGDHEAIVEREFIAGEEADRGVIADNIQFARHARGMSEAQLAAVLRVDENYIRLLEDGHVKPSGCMATQLADTLRVPQEDFVEDLP